MPNVYEYLDFRRYLFDFYRASKAVNNGFSYQVFSNRAGFKSKSFISEIISGHKSPKPDSLKKINKVLKLDAQGFNYLSDMVAFDTAKNHVQKNMYFKRLLTHKKSTPQKKVMNNQFEFYSNWHHNTIRELVTCFDFKEDYEALGQMLNPPITAYQAEQSVKLLLELEFIEKTKKGYIQSNPTITTGDEIISSVVHNFHIQNMELMLSALDKVAQEEREVSCLVMALSSDGFEKIKKKIQVFRKDLIKVALEDYGKNQVFHVNFQVVPTTKKVDE